MAMEQAQIIVEMFEVIEETFERHHGTFLDRGTSLLETLQTIDAEQASVRVGGGCASLAAQVAHVTFYLEVMERYMVAGDETRVDWDETWRTVERVSSEEWDSLRDALALTYRRVTAELRAVETWEADPHLAVALAVAVHTAYHLGEIRQALCVLGPGGR